ncbi:hypothetical protein PTKIN_Ptkin18bG0122000 [Pterospermum kingtungense]
MNIQLAALESQLEGLTSHIQQENMADLRKDMDNSFTLFERRFDSFEQKLERLLTRREEKEPVFDTLATPLGASPPS